MTGRSYMRTGALTGAVAALIAGALALWLSTGPSGHAASADQVQGTTVTVQGKAISWEDNGDCGALRASQGMFGPSATANFGISPPGGGSRFTTFFLGCVNSNASWNVEALASPLTSGADSIPGSNVTLGALPLTSNVLALGNAGDPVPASISTGCDAGLSYCSLGTTQTVVAGAQRTPDTSGFLYQYGLDVPSSAPSGTYTGSVTFTASN